MQDDDYIPPPYKSLEECAEQTQQDLWNRKEDQYIGQHRYSYPQLNFERRHSGLQSSALLRHPLCLDEQNLGGNPFFFIGRLEHFNQDFTALLSVLGLPYRSIGKSNVAKERTVQGKRRHYSAYYNEEGAQVSGGDLCARFGLVGI